MNLRLIPLILLALVSMAAASVPHAHANYRINSTALDTWPSTIGAGQALVTSVAVGQASSTGTNQILAAGTFNNGTSFSQLRIYHKSGNSLVLDANQLSSRTGVANYYLSGVQVADIDGSSLNETITIGNLQPLKNQPPIDSQIGIYRWTGTTLIQEKLFNLNVTGATMETRSLAIWASSGGVRQIVTLGYYNKTGVTSAQLGIWSWDGSTFTKDSLWNWTSTGAIGAQGYAVTTADLEGTGNPDIVTVGSSNNGTMTLSEMRVWGWTGSGSPLLKLSKTWVTTGQGSAASSVTIQDLSGNGRKEIVVGGEIFSYPFIKAELTVWQLVTVPILSLTFLAETNWQTSSQTSIDHIHVSAGDVDLSGTVEIVTAGFSDQPVGTTDVFYGSIRTWTWSGSTISLQKSFQYSTVPTAIYAVTVADIDKVGRQDIIVGGQQLTKGMVEVRDAAFVYSVFSLNANPSPALAGQSVTVSGTLTNSSDSTPLASAQVLLEYSTSGTFLILATVSTDSQGRFATSFTPSGPGAYAIRATWSGDDSHMGTTATTNLNVNKAPSAIVLSASTFNTQPGATIKITGYLYPATATTVTVTYSPPTGTSISHTAASDSTGVFSDQYSVTTIGTWTVNASWTGSVNIAGSTSNLLTINVNKIPSIIVLYTSTSNAQPGDTVKVTGYIYPATAATVTLNYNSPSGTGTSHTVTSDSTGAFSDQYTVDSAGTWTVTASWAGSTTTASSTSSALSVQTQPQPIGISLALYGFIIAIAALGVGVFSLMRKRASGKAPTSSPAKPPSP